MKSVRNFIVERLHSIDHSDPNGSGKTKDKDKIPCPKNTDGNSTTSGASISGEDESPTSQQTPKVQTPTTAGDDVPLSAGVAANDKSFKSPFDFSAATVVKQKNRRKISLPWGRQSSVAKNLGLSRQHTIDTPNSFRLFSRQSSNQLKVCI